MLVCILLQFLMFCAGEAHNVTEAQCPITHITHNITHSLVVCNTIIAFNSEIERNLVLVFGTPFRISNSNNSTLINLKSL